MEDVRISQTALRKLFGAGSGDVALLYLYLQSGGTPDGAQAALRMSETREKLALASLRQLGLVESEAPAPIRRDEAPVITEQQVMVRMTEPDFSALVGEAQRRLGRLISTAELKSLLCIHDYLRLPPEVIGMLISYCVQRTRFRGSTRAPAMRQIEKEAYYWADHNIDTLEAAAAFLQEQTERMHKLLALRQELELMDRPLTPAEERYLGSWIDMGFGPAEVALAHEKTCLNTGSMKWPYCNSILRSWHEQNLLTVEQIRARDQAPKTRPVGRAANGTPGAYEQAALEKLLQMEGEKP